MRYIAYPISSEPEDLIADVIAFIQSRFPDWQPYDGNIDTALIEAFSATASDIRELASQVPDTVFRYFGANIVGLLPYDATSATTTATVTARDTQGYTIAAGTQVGIRDALGTLVPFYVVSDVNIPPGSAVTSVGGVSLIAVQPGLATSGLGSAGGAVELIDILDWVASIVQVAITTGGIDAELDEDYLDRLRAYLTLLAPRPILPTDFALMARQIAGVYRSLAIDGYNPFHNLLSANEASVETSIADWVNLANSTLAQSATQAADGVQSLRVTAVGAGDANVFMAASKTVTPGETITVLGSARASTTVHTARVGINWRDAADASISTVFPAATAILNTGFTALSHTAVAPAGAVKARVVLSWVGAGAGEIVYWDKMSMRRGAGTDWVPGGTIETGNARMITVFSVDQNGNAVSSTIKGNIDAYLQARREINFLIYEADPTYVQIDVTYQAKKLPGYDSADLLNRVNAALTAYLNPATWGAFADMHDWVTVPVVRYLEIAQVINAVDGVDYITTTGGNYDLTIAYHGDVLARLDVPLGGAAPLAQAGTFVGTIV